MYPLKRESTCRCRADWTQNEARWNRLLRIIQQTLRSILESVLGGFGAIVDAEDCDSTDSRCAGCEGRAMDAKRLGGLRLGLSSTSIGISICMSKKVGLREQQRNVKCFSTE